MTDSQKDLNKMPVCSNCGLQVTAYSNKCNWCGAKFDDYDATLRPALMMLLKRPTEFFGRFTEFKPRFLIMNLGYFLFCFSQVVIDGLAKAVVSSSSSDTIVNLLFTAFISSIFAAFIWLPLWVIIWLYILIKQFNRTAGLQLTVITTGYAFFWPGVFSLSGVIIGLAGYILSSKGIYFVALGIKLIMVIWSFFNTGIAVKTINSFSLTRTLSILLWPVAVWLLILLVRIV